MAAQASVGESSQISSQADIFKRLHPRAYLERFAAEGFRPDGREFGDWRDIHVNVGSVSTADGSALVRLGDTTVVCGVKAEIAEPELDKPNCGFLVPNLDLPAICSPKFKPGPPSDEAQVLSERLYDVLVSADVISPSSLCIEPGKAVWVLYIDATCINFDGNAFDATLVAMLAALKNTQLPKASYNEENKRTTCSRKQKITLNVQRIPISCSFGIFDSAHVLSDPSAFEESLIDTSICVIIDEKGELMSVSQLGLGTTEDEDILSKCIARAKKRRTEISSMTTLLS